MKGEIMKKVITFFVLIFAFTSLLFAQTPQYYNANTGGISNSLPFGNTNGYKNQWLIGPNEYILPTPCPAGNITKLYIFMATTGGPATFTNLKVKFGQTSITAFPTGEYTGQLDSFYYNTSATLSSTANSWMCITLDRPFTYNPSQSLVIEISHCGFSGSGMNVFQIAGTSGIIRRNNIPGTTSCVFTYSGQDTRILQCGVDIATPSPNVVNRSLLLPTPGSSSSYVQVPYNASMVGFGNNITIEAWVKPGGSTTANTVLNKGTSYFDYQLGISASTMLPFFRAGTNIATCPFTVPVGVWSHLAVVSDGSTVTFYLNGVAGTPVSKTTTLGSSTNEMRIGRGNNDAGSGKIDELRLWSVVRTAGEIGANMCNKWLPNSTTGLKAKWHFDSTFVDSVSGWNGNPMGSASFDTAVNCVISNVGNIQNEIPKEFKLYQNYPNPFNPTTTIKFNIPKDAYVEMKLYDVLGKEVSTLISDPYRAGMYYFDFNASNLASGIYFYRIIAGDFKDIKKMILIK